MKSPHRMRLDELLSLPVISSTHLLDRVERLGGCFEDRDGELWGTCLLGGGGTWARYQAVRSPRECDDLPIVVMSEFSTLRGFFDFCDGARVAGWAQDEANPDEAVCVEVVVNGKSVAHIHADQFRNDLLEEKIGDGRHGFNVALPRPLSLDRPHRIVMQRCRDGAFINLTTFPLARTPPPAS